MSDPPHYHLVQKPGEEEQQAVCSLPDARCPFSEATPEQIGRWLSMGLSVVPFADWLERDNQGLTADNVIWLPDLR